MRAHDVAVSVEIKVCGYAAIVVALRTFVVEMAAETGAVILVSAVWLEEVKGVRVTTVGSGAIEASRLAVQGVP